ncbi:hypothetical protein DPMN_063421 [Dreissena polymorpha]|uniref:Uncharacterized protein n=1 Tax=Dreissena polymorpha TaxID=45954 RepID=A0A9D4CAH4_DREPO|nr:hypothetical protein DPMN_063421 [Dreissena polymorpha]
MRSTRERSSTKNPLWSKVVLTGACTSNGSNCQQIILKTMKAIFSPSRRPQWLGGCLPCTDKSSGIWASTMQAWTRGEGKTWRYHFDFGSAGESWRLFHVPALVTFSASVAHTNRRVVKIPC